jgi:hypothetical protein
MWLSALALLAIYNKIYSLEVRDTKVGRPL